MLNYNSEKKFKICRLCGIRSYISIGYDGDCDYYYDYNDYPIENISITPDRKDINCIAFFYRKYRYLCRKYRREFR